MMSHVLQERAEIEEEIEGLTLCGVLLDAAERWGAQPALSDRESAEEGWQTLSWAQARERALHIAAGFAALGLAPGERVALMLPNRAEHVLADVGAVHAAGVPVTFYSTLAAEQVAYVAADCDARIAVLEGAAELARWEPVLGRLPGLKKIIVRDPAALPAGARSAGAGPSSGEMFLGWAEFLALGAERYAAAPRDVEGRIAAIRPDDPAAMLYTSGTTGNPKGVPLTHRNVLYEMAAGMRTGNVPRGVRWVSYLPLAHIAERMFSIYLPMVSGGHVFFCHEATALIGVVGSVRPTAFFGVPRVWEKVQAGIRVLLASEQDPARRAAVESAMDVGRRYVESRQFGRSTPPELAAAFGTADEKVLAPIRSLLGMGEATVVSSAAAPLSPDVASFFAGLGMMILDLYGMTETSGAFTSNTPEVFRMGTVGRAMAGLEVAIADDGEILVRGPVTTNGYLNLPDQTGQLLDADGWLHTGDIGSMDEDGFLSVTDRKKELIITAGGENISPAGVENLLVAHPLIGQALAFGDRRPYVVALLTLDGEVAPVWARARGIEAGSLAELAAHPDVLTAVGEAVAAANENLARVQQVKRWRLLPVEWTTESEELTPTMKLKRRVVHAKYADDIDTLYAG